MVLVGAVLESCTCSAREPAKLQAYQFIFELLSGVNPKYDTIHPQVTTN